MRHMMTDIKREPLPPHVESLPRSTPAPLARVTLRVVYLPAAALLGESRDLFVVVFSLRQH